MKCWQHSLSAMVRSQFMQHMFCLRTAAANCWKSYLWQDISPLLPGHAGGGVQLVGLDGHNVVVVAQVPGGGGHTKVIPRWQSHSLCVKKTIGMLKNQRFVSVKDLRLDTYWDTRSPGALVSKIMTHGQPVVLVPGKNLNERCTDI